MRRVLLLCSLSSSLATIGLGDGVALHQHALHLQRRAGPASKARPETTELVAQNAAVAAARLKGPKALMALKLAMHKVNNLDFPAFLDYGGISKKEVDRKISLSLATMLNATQATWLLSDEELAEVERRFHRTAMRHIAPALMGGRYSASPAFWQQFWEQAKHSFVRSIFDDEKAWMKPEDVELSIEEVVKPPKLRKRRQEVGAFTVVVGPCSLDTDGCLLSPHYPHNYTNRDTCVVSVNKSMTGPLNVTHFDTEVMADILIVNGVRYSGSIGPNGEWPQEDIVWFSDYMQAGTGFRLCPTGPSSSVAPGGWERSRTNLTVSEGNCTVDSSGCAKSTNYPNAYPNNDHCVIDVNKGAVTPLHVQDFSTEVLWDRLVVNGQNFSGDVGPEGVVPFGQIVWSADYSYNSAGWKVCPQGAYDPREVNNSVFNVRVGDCSVGQDGCVQSPLYPAAYPNAGICVIGVNTSTVGPLRMEHFFTEKGYDTLTVNGMRFSGSLGPSEVVPYEDMVWFSDFQATTSGWKICSGPKPNVTEEEITHAAPNFTLVEGNCIIKDLCASSPHYPSRYGNNEHCLINVSTDNDVPLHVLDFVTESQLDALFVNGKPFSGISGPDGVVPRGQIEWVTDVDVRAGGWKICFMEPSPGVAASTTTSSTSTTSTTTSTTTTTTTMIAREEVSPWEDLAYHVEVSRAMLATLAVVSSRVRHFDGVASDFRGRLLTSRPSERSCLKPHVKLLLTHINGTVFEPWLGFPEELKMAFDRLLEVVMSQPSFQNRTFTFFFQRHLDMYEQNQEFRKRLEWFGAEMEQQHRAMLEQTPEVLPLKLKALKVSLRTFRKEVNEFLEHAYADFNIVPNFFKDQILDPIHFVGHGSCVDSEGKMYDTLESKGCDTAFWCAHACRRIDACRGFTMSYPKLGDRICTRCELRVEEGYKGNDTHWKYTWQNGSATGPIAGASGRAPGDANLHCFTHEPYNTTGWTSRMRAAVEEEQAMQIRKYNAVTEEWIDLVATMKGAFWKIMSGIDDATSKAVAAKLEMHRRGVAEE